MAVVSRESPPLLITELLSSIHKVMQRYCQLQGAPPGENYLTEESLRQNFSTAYLLLDEMIDASGIIQRVFRRSIVLIASVVKDFHLSALAVAV